MLPQYMALSVSFVSVSKKNCVSVRWVTLWVRPPPFENMCVHLLGYIVGAFPPCVCPFVGSLHAAYSALRHFYCFIQIYTLQNMKQLYGALLTHQIYSGNYGQNEEFQRN